VTGTDIVFGRFQKTAKRKSVSTHVGWFPRFNATGLFGAWGTLVNENLRKLITMGRVHQTRSNRKKGTRKFLDNDGLESVCGSLRPC